jgi:hypothetical protein
MVPCLFLAVSFVPIQNIPFNRGSSSNSPAENMRNFINLLFSIKLISLSLNTCSLLPGTLLISPPLPSPSLEEDCQTLTESNILNDTYLLTPEFIKVWIKGPLEGNIAGNNDKAYRLLFLSKDSSSGVVDADA